MWDDILTCWCYLKLCKYLGSQTVGLTGHRDNAGLSTACNHSNVRTTILKVQYVHIWISSLKLGLFSFCFYSPIYNVKQVIDISCLLSSSQFLHIWLFEEDCTSWFGAIKIRAKTMPCISLTSYLCCWHPRRVVYFHIFSEKINIFDPESLTIKPTRENLVINKSPGNVPCLTS